jgi:fibronectin type 3 domain-containing protein
MYNIRRLLILSCLSFFIFLLPTDPISAFQVRQESSRFDQLVIYDPSRMVSVSTLPLEYLSAHDSMNIEWESFLTAHGENWKIYLDGRSGAPILVEGQGIPWIPGSGNQITAPSEVTLDYLEDSLRAFLSINISLFLAQNAELSFNDGASGRITPELYQIVFDRTIDGIPVSGDRYIFAIGHGNLISFGATRWGRIDVNTVPTLDERETFLKLTNYMQIYDEEQITFRSNGELLIVPMAAPGTESRPYAGEIGEGYHSALAWKFVLKVAGEPGKWAGMVDAHTGEILALYDEIKYAQVKGGVYPETADGICPSGCEQPNFPMPFADVDIDGNFQLTDRMGLFDCTPEGSTATTTLNGAYVSVNESCGSIFESAICNEDIDMSFGPGEDCAVPSGASPGNTHGARSSFYHINRAREHASFFLPENEWLQEPLGNNVNLSGSCNAFWDYETVNFLQSNPDCRNTAEVAGVVLHEWGHGLDNFDGGYFDIPTEAYADITEFMYDHTSCIGRGFYRNMNCKGYGNTCLDCTGVREHDWDKKIRHVPSTPTNYVRSSCSIGDAPCGGSQHCEGIIGGETLWDLANRDLPAMGLDPASAWQHTDKLWYESREGSGGMAYNCILPDSDGCGTYTWFSKLRVVDDDDGDLSNGTPHAAAIFAAFDRHDIACGNASDPSNQNTSTCPVISGTTLSAASDPDSITLSWDAVSNADHYNIFKNDIRCDHSYNIVATVDAPETSYADTGLATDFFHYYRVQAVGSNSACDGPVSNCIDLAATSYAGSITLNRGTYNCDMEITITVRDANVNSSTAEVTVWSTTEPEPETVILNETSAGSSQFVGTIHTTSDPPLNDGLLSLSDGDSITAQYIDADDGAGGYDIFHQATASSDCIAPIISNVHPIGIYDTSAAINWNTDEASDGLLIWGPFIPPSIERYSPELLTVHTIQLKDLQPCTRYYYKVSSTDGGLNTATDDNDGQYYYFETSRDVGGMKEQCHKARLNIMNGEPLRCTDALEIQLDDLDLNLDYSVSDTVLIPVTSNTESEPELAELTETGPNTATFTGTMQLSKGAPSPDGILQADDQDLVTVSYLDADDGEGSGGWIFDTTDLDCAGPKILDLRMINISDQRLTVRFDTEDFGDAVVEWGPTPGLGETVSKPDLRKVHEVHLNRLSACDPIYIRVSSSDEYGNTSIGDCNGEPHKVHTWHIPGLYWQETFEGDTSGWTMDGEWEIGTPQGLGGIQYLWPDPVGAYNHDMCMGDDLTGLGIYPGDYENLITETSLSPSLDASSWTNTKLLFYRYLNVFFLDTSTVKILEKNNEHEIFNNNAESINDDMFLKKSFDVSSIVDGEKSFQLEFELISDIETQPVDDGFGSGWNVDDIIFKDGTLPDYAGCGGCGMTPSFNGATGVFDNDACGADGVTISWDQAVSWGTGENGTYAIYRDTVPDFMPTGTNLVESGVTALSCNDLSAPTNQDLYYLVLAENDETCSDGPNNAGVTNDNYVYLPVTETTSWPTPEEVTPLSASMLNHAHLQLAWEATSGATSYRIYRSVSPNGVFTLLGETEELIFDDDHQGGNTDSYYYLVTGVSPCDVEGP